MICRQVANKMGLTASFLPKPVVGVTAAACTPNVSISENGKIFSGSQRERKSLAKPAGPLLTASLPRQRHSLLLNASVNAYRRLGPALRSAQPDQSLAGRPRLHDPDPHRQ